MGIHVTCPHCGRDTCGLGGDDLELRVRWPAGATYRFVCPHCWELAEKECPAPALDRLVEGFGCPLVLDLSELEAVL